MLRKGSKGSEVKVLQQRLLKLGYKLPKYGADGDFGNETDAAVRQFQKDNKLVVDGIYGANTSRALYSAEHTTPHFVDSEFKCHCGGKYCNGYPVAVSTKLKQLLEEIRTEVNRKYPLSDGKKRGIAIKSGIRCKQWNAKVGGSSGSKHLLGIAADITVSGINNDTLGKLCDYMNPNGGVGYGSGHYPHVDVRGSKARWKY